ncbi:unnamed protein product [Cladocopium goreaui]|uniref:Uncharacterized protein n=1 Tax=Cladocopium goreaui TaxID=2562237 RepID=A0A9P1DUM6_9DINO|nr:unnamed protein product [Cladocopium goreaui]
MPKSSGDWNDNDMGIPRPVIHCGGILAKPLTATRVQKGLRLPALATTSWSRTSSVLTTTDSLPVDTGSGAQAPELHCATPTSLTTLPPTFTSPPTISSSTLCPRPAKHSGSSQVSTSPSKKQNTEGMAATQLPDEHGHVLFEDQLGRPRVDCTMMDPGASAFLMGTGPFHRYVEHLKQLGFAVETIEMRRTCRTFHFGHPWPWRQITIGRHGEYLLSLTEDYEAELADQVPSFDLRLEDQADEFQSSGEVMDFQTYQKQEGVFTSNDDSPTQPGERPVLIKHWNHLDFRLDHSLILLDLRTSLNLDLLSQLDPMDFMDLLNFYMIQRWMCRSAWESRHANPVQNLNFKHLNLLNHLNIQFHLHLQFNTLNHLNSQLLKLHNLTHTLPPCINLRQMKTFELTGDLETAALPTGWKFEDGYITLEDHTKDFWELKAGCLIRHHVAFETEPTEAFVNDQHSQNDTAFEENFDHENFQAPVETYASHGGGSLLLRYVLLVTMVQSTAASDLFSGNQCSLEDAPIEFSETDDIYLFLAFGVFLLCTFGFGLICVFARLLKELVASRRDGHAQLRVDHAEQQAENIQLQQRVIDINAQITDQQTEIRRLRAELIAAQGRLVDQQFVIDDHAAIREQERTQDQRSIRTAVGLLDRILDETRNLNQVRIYFAVTGRCWHRRHDCNGLNNANQVEERYACSFCLASLPPYEVGTKRGIKHGALTVRNGGATRENTGISPMNS